MSTPGDNPCPSPETSLLPWPEQRGPKSAVLRNDWERFPCPKELHCLPDGEQTAYEIRQIVKRSLYKHDLQLSVFQQFKPEEQISEVYSDRTLQTLPGVPDRQDQESVGSAESWKSCNGEGDIPSSATGPTASLVPDPLKFSSSKSRELRPKSSFLSSKIGRLGAKLEKLELVASRRNSRNFHQQKNIVIAECAGCLDDLPKSDVTSLSCTHSYCKLCFITLITTAMHTESLFPPKCCLTEIPLKTVLHALGDEQRSSYKQKAAEWAQPTEKRWYCPEPKCAQWITPSKIHSTWATGLTCPQCRTAICRTCRGLAHAQETHCPQDFGMLAMLDVAEREGWRRCYQCKALVEKTSGCRHMTCTCKAQFCYTCGSKWKTCGCTEVDQARREEELRERRRTVDTEARREEEEIARAIAAFEMAEREEAQEREAAERRIEEERQREEEELRRLEELRLVEEEQRRRDEEDAERKRIETIKISVEERTASLRKMLTELAQFQQIALISRQENTVQNTKTNSKIRVASRQEDYERQKRKLLANIEKRSKHMKQKHDTEKYAITSRHEEEEDAMFIQVQMHLRGKSNRDVREKAMLETLTKSHKDELAGLTDMQTREAADLREVAALEAKGLELGHRARLEETTNKAELKFLDLNQEVIAERHWFEAVTHRRHALLEELRTGMLRTVGESSLLDEWETLPFPVVGPRFSFSGDEQDLVNDSARSRNSLPTLPSSFGALEKIPALSVTTDQCIIAAQPSKPPKPSLFISTGMAESHTTSDKYFQSTHQAQSQLSEQSGTTSTTSRLSLNLQRRGGIKTNKLSRWSFLNTGSDKEQMDKETFKTISRRTVVGDASHTNTRRVREALCV